MSACALPGMARRRPAAGALLRLLLAVLLLTPLAALAQGTATLVADRVTLDGQDRLTAEGNVEAYYDGTRLSAASITYDRTRDRLVIVGPIFLQGADGQIVTADRAELDPRLESGLLRGARLVLDRQLQLAAAQIDRVDGRYSQLTRAAATSCQVCDGRAPLWEIRAERVVHDDVAQQIWFENATFRIRGVPILWVPRMRLPDPRLERSSGLLIPRLRSTDRLGLGLKLPYFITIGSARDLTLTPYLSAETSTLEARYRQAFFNGSLQIDGAISDDSIRPGDTRGYLATQGTFLLGSDYRLSFDTLSASDPAYLLEYGYSDADRLISEVTLERYRLHDLTRAVVTQIETLRDGEIREELPPLLFTLDRERRLEALGGTATLAASADGFFRPKGPAAAETRDMARIGARAGWRRDWMLPAGLLLSAGGRLATDVYRIADDPDAPPVLARAVPSADVRLRWPLIRHDSGGATQVLEPVASLTWSDRLGRAPPNEDSAFVEFDEGNLDAIDRFPGEDAAAVGWRGVWGLSWTRIGTSGDVARLSFGQVRRDRADDRFTAASGLSGRASDWLVAGQLDLADGFSLDARALWDPDDGFGKSAAQVLWSGARVDLAAAYIWLPQDRAEDRPAAISEWTFEADWQVTGRWSLAVDTRYDVVADRPTRAGLGVGWQNECVTVDLSISRRYTSSTDVDPSTDFGLAVNLNGFSAGRAAAVPPGQCRE